MQAQFSIPLTGAEVWRPVLGYEGLYDVSDLGRVRRIARSAGTRGGILSPEIDRKGYLRVDLYLSGKRQRKLVHALVAAAFLGPFAPGEETDHKNGVKADNRLVNIEKVTHGENIRRAIGLGLRDTVGESNPRAKLSEDDIRTIRRLAETVTVRELALRFRITPRAVRLIIRRRTWRHI